VSVGITSQEGIGVVRLSHRECARGASCCFASPNQACIYFRRRVRVSSAAVAREEPLATPASVLELALDNLESILTAADMTFADVVRLNAYATDVDELFKHFPRITERFGNSRYATTVLGVAQLPAQLLVMLEATAVD
jgi:hypothetical protein